MQNNFSNKNKFIIFMTSTILPFQQCPIK